MKTEIIYEDANILVCYKPAGLPVQTAKVGQMDMVSELKNYLHSAYLGIIHRLDQPVEGLLVFAKDTKSAARLSAYLQKGTLNKQYYGVICGKPSAPGRELVDYLKKEKDRAVVVTEAYQEAKSGNTDRRNPGGTKNKMNAASNAVSTRDKTNAASNPDGTKNKTNVASNAVSTRNKANAASNPGGTKNKMNAASKTVSRRNDQAAIENSVQQAVLQYQVMKDRYFQEEQYQAPFNIVSTAGAIKDHNGTEAQKQEQEALPVGRTEKVENPEDKGAALSLLDIHIDTGRFHQIRAQLSHAGMPLLGDSKYGNEESLLVSRQLAVRNVALCAYKIEFLHPVTGERKVFEIAPKGKIFSQV